MHKYTWLGAKMLRAASLMPTNIQMLRTMRSQDKPAQIWHQIYQPISSAVHRMALHFHAAISLKLCICHCWARIRRPRISLHGDGICSYDPE
jgi:hypothetical protein